MNDPHLMLTELERDTLTELVNIGVSRAASSLRKMVGEEILLSVPSIEVVTRATAGALIRERESDRLVAVRQDFSGAFSGRALLIFPASNSFSLVRAVTGDRLPPEDLAELQDEALAETGNVVLNGCLATMANMLKRPLSMSVPEVLHGAENDLFATSERDEGVVLFLYINFAVNDRSIRGYIAMLMDLPSVEALKIVISEFIQRVVGSPSAAS